MAKSEHEKTNKDSEEVAFKRKYNDNVQSEKISIKDDIKRTFFASLKENIASIAQNSILPPSKLDIGSRFNIPRKSEDKMNSCPKLNERSGVDKVMTAHRRFIAGPAEQINISFEKEPRDVIGTSDAPNGDNRISRNLTLDRRAAAICPSS